MTALLPTATGARDGAPAYNIQLDEVGATRAMTGASDLLRPDQIMRTDDILRVLLTRAPHIVAMEYRMRQVRLLFPHSVAPVR